MKCKSEFNVSPFIPHDVEKNIRKVGLEYILLLQIVDIERELVVVAEYSYKEKPKKNQTGEKYKPSTRMIEPKGGSLSRKEK